MVSRQYLKTTRQFWSSSSAGIKIQKTIDANYSTHPQTTNIFNSLVVKNHSNNQNKNLPCCQRTMAFMRLVGLGILGRRWQWKIRFQAQFPFLEKWRKDEERRAIFKDPKALKLGTIHQSINNHIPIPDESNKHLWTTSKQWDTHTHKIKHNTWANLLHRSHPY